MAYVNHLNYADEKGRVFCIKSKRIVVLDGYQFKICSQCPFFRGSNQGRGIECYWDDPRAKEGDSVWSATEPFMEQESALGALNAERLKHRRK